MKKILLPFLLLFALVKGYSQSGVCDTFYWNHTYANERLKIYDSCVTITAVMSAVFIPPCYVCPGVPGTGDGDYHIYIYPDSAYQWMQYYRDTAYTKLCEGSDSTGYLVCPTCLNVEEVCHGDITDTGPDSIVEGAACANWTDTLYVPNQGEHIRVTGPYVYDTVHCWNEIHPVSKMVVIPAAGISDPSLSAINSLKVFPQPATNAVTFQFASAPQAVVLVKFYTIDGRHFLAYGMAQTNSLEVDVSVWPTGEYLYSIVTEDQSKTLRSGKFTVLH